ncbi:MAG: peptidase [Ponticaulis sp.]|nr:peptidase [Ponticaulis sp.]
METTPVGQGPELTGNVLFYRKPEPLSLEAHGKLGVKRIDQPFGFLRQAHAVPVTISEFGMTASSYPVIFVGAEKTPVAVMGVSQGVNLFVDADGKPLPEYYLPAFVRRYPFVFAADDNQDRLLLCVDREAPMVSDNPDMPFFEGDQPSKYTQDAIEFCKEFERQRRGTAEFVKLMESHDLFEQKTVTYKPRDEQGNEGQAQKIADYWAISEEKLNKLPAETFIQLRDQNVLGAVYSHLVSLLNWSNIIQRAIRMQQAPSA